MPRACLSGRRGGKNYYIEKIKVCNMLIRKEIIPIDEVYSAVKDVLFEPNRKKSFVKCPQCGGELIFEGGCNTCKSCGWSKCD